MTYQFGEFELDPLLYQLRRGGEVIRLEPKIFDVLAYLIRQRERVVSKGELLEALWPGEFVSESVLPRCIATARKALGDTRARPAAIATVHGRGYRFIAEVRHADGAAADAPGESGRGPLFVGREDVLARLRAALDDAWAGRGRLVLLVGEPGIGKTRTAEEVAAEARRRGARTAAGRCHEGEGAPAFWPWVQVLRACLRGRAADAAPGTSLPGAAELAPLLPELADAPRDAPPTALPDEARFRLFDAVARFLAGAAAAQPLVILLDDLHWADGPSLMLLQYLAREMGESRLLLVGTYRDVELNRQHPLARVLGDLARAPLSERVHLRGLGADDVGRFLAARAGGPPSPALLSAVVEMTEGNPFFLEEVARLLESEGRLRPGGADEPQRWGVILPQSVREAIGRRLDALSATCNRVLAVASVVGRDFDVPLLEPVLAAAGAAGEGPLSRAAILAALDEAVATRLVASEAPAPGRYAFAHALVRQTLYAELSTPLRLRLHHRVAEVLEAQHAADLEPHLAELAHHLFQAAAAGGAAKAAAVGLRAAQRAQALLAYEDAVRHCERALQLLELDPEAGSPEQRVELLLALADAHSAAGAREPSRTACRRAAGLARTLARPDLLARAALLFGQRTEAGPLPAEELRRLLEEALAALGDGDPALRSRLLSHLSSVPPYQDSIETRAQLCRQAVDLARRSGDLTALFDAQGAELWSLLGPANDRTRMRAAAELAQLAERTGVPERRLLPMEHRASSFLLGGDLAAADRETAAYLALAEELRQPSFILIGKWYWVARALCDGRFADAEASMRECFDLGRRLQHPANSGVLHWHVYWSLRVRGRLTEYAQAAEEVLSTYGESLVLPSGFHAPIEPAVGQFYFSGPFLPAVTASVYAAIGEEDTARRAFEELARHDFADVAHDEWWMPTITHLAELGARFGDARRCRALQALLEPFAACNAVAPLLRTYDGSVAHHLGLLAAAQRQRDAAAGYFETALARNAALGARPALVGTQIAYGRLLLGRGRRAEERRGRALLQEAHATAQAIGLSGVAAAIPKEIINNP